MGRFFIVAFDFDCTVTFNDRDFPEPGPQVDAAVAALQKFTADERIALLLLTCREGDLLEIALAWLRERNIHVDAANEPTPDTKWKTRKPHFDLLVDDRAFPRQMPPDWPAVEKYVFGQLNENGPPEDIPFYSEDPAV